MVVVTVWLMLWVVCACVSVCNVGVFWLNASMDQACCWCEGTEMHYVMLTAFVGNCVMTRMTCL